MSEREEVDLNAYRGTLASSLVGSIPFIGNLPGVREGAAELANNVTVPTFQLPEFLSTLFTNLKNGLSNMMAFIGRQFNMGGSSVDTATAETQAPTQTAESDPVAARAAAQEAANPSIQGGTPTQGPSSSNVNTARARAAAAVS